MKTMRITSAEEKMIMEHRKSIKHEKATQRFRTEIFELAFEFNKYLEKKGLCHSFSEFINCFDLPISNLNKLKYEAVTKVFETVKSLEFQRGFDPC